MRLRNSCVNGLALPITRLMLVLGVQFCLIGQLSAQSLIPQQAQMHPDLADSQMHLVNAMDSTRGMFGGSWKMSKVGLSTDIKPQAKLGGAVVKMTARAWSSGAKGDVHVAGGLPGEPTHEHLLGGGEMDEAIVNFLRREQNLLIGEASAERIKKNIGIARKPEKSTGIKIEVRGRDLVNGVPKEITITEAQVAEAISDPVRQVVDGVKMALEQAPPELAADIVEKGIVMTGGGALLRDIDGVLRDATGLPISIADDPLSCVALGTGRCLEELRTLRNVLIGA